MVPVVVVMVSESGGVPGVKVYVPPLASAPFCASLSVGGPKLGYIAKPWAWACWNWVNMVPVRVGKKVLSSAWTSVVQLAGVYWVPVMLPQRADSSIIAWLIVLVSCRYMAAEVAGERTVFKSV